MLSREEGSSFFNLKEMLMEFIAHRDEVIVRRTRYDLAIAEARAHILEGLKIALDNIDAVIKTIKGIKNSRGCALLSCKKFALLSSSKCSFSDSPDSKKKIEDELFKEKKSLSQILDILSKPARVIAIIGRIISRLKGKYLAIHVTEFMLLGAIGEFNPTDTIPNESVVVTFSKNGYIKAVKHQVSVHNAVEERGSRPPSKDEDEIASIF